MPERVTSPPEHETLPRLQEYLATHLERHGHKITPTELGHLIGNIETADLSNDPLVAVVGRVPIAKVRHGEVTLDRQFHEFSQEQQAHVLLHEYSHALTWFLREQPEGERYAALSQLVASLPGHQVSYYVNYLETAVDDTPEKQAFIHEERLAEVFAQYLESDRTFGGFITAKLLEFPQGDQDINEEERRSFEEIAAQVGELGEYLDIADSEEEREAFLERHSDLLPHYELWREMTALLDETDFSMLEGFHDDIEDDDYEFWEDLALAEYLHSESVSSGASARTAFGQETADKKAPSSFLADIINFWRIFPD